jgi:phospholipase/carboxylesterase
VLAVRRILAWSACVSLLAVACSEPYGARPAASHGTPASASTTPPAGPANDAPAAANDAASDALPIAARLRYVEVILGDAKPDDRLPMIIAIHGLGDDPRNFGHLFDTFTEPARLILPQGIDPRDGGGFSWFPLRARDPDVTALAAGIGRAAEEIAASIEVLVASRNTAGKPILTGFSQGGMLTFAVAARHPELLGLALPVSGWLPPPLVPDAAAPKGAPPIVAFHGTEDGAVKYEPTKIGVEALEQHGWNVALVTYPGIGHVITPEVQRDLFDRIVDGVREAAQSKSQSQSKTPAPKPKEPG